VRDGKWTIAKLDEITRTVYTDLNGNTEYDENDLYGLSSCSICIDCFWASSGITFVGKNDAGELELTIGDGFYDAYEQISELLQAPEMLYTDRPQYTSKRDTYDRDAFKEDRALFFIEGLCIAEADLRLRGPGDFLSTGGVVRQHGTMPLTLAAGLGDMDVMEKAFDAARTLLEEDPALSLPEHAALREAVNQVRQAASSTMN